MEWVHTTGSSVEEAKDRALDGLGVDEQDAEFEVLEEPKTGLFGRVRGEARVRARVRPTQPRGRNDRGDRGRGKRRGRGKGKGGGGRGSSKQGHGSGGKKGGGGDRSRSDGGSGKGGSNKGQSDRKGSGNQNRPSRKQQGSDKGRRSGGRGQGKKSKDGSRDTGARTQMSSDRTRKEATMTEDVAVEEQGEIVAGFLEGLLDAFGADGEVLQEQVDENTIEFRVEGDDLGLLIGPRGNTLTAVHEMCRTVLQREVAGGARARIRVDIGGYRQRRREALAKFARAQAEGVLEDQTQRALEPMGAADRKVIHDTVNEIAGVQTVSEGEDPRRRVVIVPDGD